MEFKTMVPFIEEAMSLQSITFFLFHSMSFYASI